MSLYYLPELCYDEEVEIVAGGSNESNLLVADESGQVKEGISKLQIADCEGVGKSSPQESGVQNIQRSAALASEEWSRATFAVHPQGSKKESEAGLTTEHISASNSTNESTIGKSVSFQDDGRDKRHRQDSGKQLSNPYPSSTKNLPGSGKTSESDITNDGDGDDDDADPDVIEAARKHGALAAAIQLMEEGAESLEQLVSLTREMNVPEFLNATEERALAGRCGNPMCPNPRDLRGFGSKFRLRSENITRSHDLTRCCSDACSRNVDTFALRIYKQRQLEKQQERLQVEVDEYRRLNGEAAPPPVVQAVEQQSCSQQQAQAQVNGPDSASSRSPLEERREMSTEGASGKTLKSRGGGSAASSFLVGSDGSLSVGSSTAAAVSDAAAALSTALTRNPVSHGRAGVEGKPTTSSSSSSSAAACRRRKAPVDNGVAAQGFGVMTMSSVVKERDARDVERETLMASQALSALAKSTAYSKSMAPGWTAPVAGRSIAAATSAVEGYVPGTRRSTFVKAHMQPLKAKDDEADKQRRESESESAPVLPSPEGEGEWKSSVGTSTSMSNGVNGDSSTNSAPRLKDGAGPRELSGAGEASGTSPKVKFADEEVYDSEFLRKSGSQATAPRRFSPRFPSSSGTGDSAASARPPVVIGGRTSVARGSSSGEGDRGSLSEASVADLTSQCESLSLSLESGGGDGHAGFSLASARDSELPPFLTSSDFVHAPHYNPGSSFGGSKVHVISLKTAKATPTGIASGIYATAPGDGSDQEDDEYDDSAFCMAEEEEDDDAAMNRRFAGSLACEEEDVNEDGDSRGGKFRGGKAGAEDLAPGRVKMSSRRLVGAADDGSDLSSSADSSDDEEEVEWGRAGSAARQGTSVVIMSHARKDAAPKPGPEAGAAPAQTTPSEGAGNSKGNHFTSEGNVDKDNVCSYDASSPVIGLGQAPAIVLQASSNRAVEDIVVERVPAPPTDALRRANGAPAAPASAAAVFARTQEAIGRVAARQAGMKVKPMVVPIEELRSTTPAQASEVFSGPGNVLPAVVNDVATPTPASDAQRASAEAGVAAGKTNTVDGDNDLDVDTDGEPEVTYRDEFDDDDSEFDDDEDSELDDEAEAAGSSGDKKKPEQQPEKVGESSPRGVSSRDRARFKNPYFKAAPAAALERRLSPFALLLGYLGYCVTPDTWDYVLESRGDEPAETCTPVAAASISEFAAEAFLSDNFPELAARGGTATRGKATASSRRASNSVESKSRINADVDDGSARAGSSDPICNLTFKCSTRVAKAEPEEDSLPEKGRPNVSVSPASVECLWVFDKPLQDAVLIASSSGIVVSGSGGWSPKAKSSGGGGAPEKPRKQAQASSFEKTSKPAKGILKRLPGFPLAEDGTLGNSGDSSSSKDSESRSASKAGAAAVSEPPASPNRELFIQLVMAHFDEVAAVLRDMGGGAGEETRKDYSGNDETPSSSEAGDRDATRTFQEGIFDLIKTFRISEPPPDDLLLTQPQQWQRQLLLAFAWALALNRVPALRPFVRSGSGEETVTSAGNSSGKGNGDLAVEGPRRFFAEVAKRGLLTLQDDIVSEAARFSSLVGFLSMRL